MILFGVLSYQHNSYMTLSDTLKLCVATCKHNPADLGAAAALCQLRKRDRFYAFDDNDENLKKTDVNIRYTSSHKRRLTFL